MADKASAERVAADMQPPNFRAAVQRIRSAIQKKKDKIGEINGEISTEWAKIESFKVNKKAGRIFAMLDKLENPERIDIMRSLNGLMDAAGWDAVEGDLVDRSDGNVVHMRLPADRGSDAGGDDDDDDAGGGDGEGDETEMAAVEAALAEPAKPRRGRRPKDADQADAERTVAKSASAARERVRKHFGQDAGGEPFTGDNSDLKPE